MKVHLIDGTFELFRAYFGSPSAIAADGQEVGAVRGLMRSLLGLLTESDVSHVAVAFDREVKSFRNELFPAYKSGEDTEPELLAQFRLAEDAVSALGFVVWPMIEFEADDALASAAAKFANAAGVRQIVICSPDKDLAQCVTGRRIVCRDRLRRKTLDDAGVKEKFGVDPGSIPDWIGLVGDAADGLPGIPRWGAKSSAAVLSVYKKIEAIPVSAADWQLSVRGAVTLATNLSARKADALLYRELATLRRDVPIVESLDDLRWQGPRADALQVIAARLGDDRILRRAEQIAEVVRG